MKNLNLVILALISLFVFEGLSAQTEGKSIHVEYLSVETFKEKVFDYTKHEDWVYEGDTPCIVDFYADWCKPCKMVAPILDELADEYDGNLKIYKVNTDKNRELSQVFGVRSIPAILFVPMEGKPQMSTGALPKTTFYDVIDEFLMVEKPQK